MSETSSLLVYLGVLRRRKWVLLQALILVPALALVLSLRQSELFEGNVDVALERQDLADRLSGLNSDPGADTFLQILQREAAIARSPTVARQVVGDIQGRMSVRAFLANSSVEVDEQSSLLGFKVSNEDKRVAAALPRVYAEAYLAYKRRLATVRYDGALTELNDRLETFNTPAEQNSEVYRQLVQQRERLQVLQATVTSQGAIVSSNPPEKVRPQPMRSGLLGLFIGAILGILLAFVIEALDRRLRRVSDVKEMFDVPFLGGVPDIPHSSDPHSLFVMEHEPRGLSADSYRALKASVQAVLPAGFKTVMVISGREGEGKTTTACNLAAAFALSGKQVSLVDLDLHRPTAHRVVGQLLRPGVADMAFAGVNLRAASHQVRFRQRIPVGIHEPPIDFAEEDPFDTGGAMRFVPAGVAPLNVGDLVGMLNVQELLDTLRETSDLIIVDAPPLVSPSALELTRHVDAVLMVVRLGVADRRSLSEAQRILSMSPVPTLGLVVTAADRDPDAKTLSYYGYYGNVSSDR